MVDKPTTFRRVSRVLVNENLSHSSSGSSDDEVRVGSSAETSEWTVDRREDLRRGWFEGPAMGSSFKVSWVSCCL